MNASVKNLFSDHLIMRKFPKYNAQDAKNHTIFKFGINFNLKIYLLNYKNNEINFN